MKGVIRVVSLGARRAWNVRVSEVIIVSGDRKKNLKHTSPLTL